MKKIKVPKKVYKPVPNEIRIRDQNRLLKPFLKKYNKPVIVHSTHNLEIFNKILEQGKIKVPKEHDSPKISPYLEKFLGIGNSIYYSLGFVYVATYDFKYGFIFDLSFLKELEYYYGSIGYRCYHKAMTYLYYNDKKSLDKLKNINKTTKKIMNAFLHEEDSHGHKRFFFPFWVIEKFTYDFIMNHKKKRKLMNLIKEKKKELKYKYPYSVRAAKKNIKEKSFRVPEILGFKNNNLKKNPYFLGFYIGEKVPKRLMRKLKEEYPDKILFDGKKIKKISEIKKPTL
jgi:hypothetical protein